jgi:hypothetical protein
MPNSHAPIVLGGYIGGMAAQTAECLRLNDPTPGGVSKSDRTPVFTWSVCDNPSVQSKVFVSTYAPGVGLFPSDTPAGANPTWLIHGDINFTRIVNGLPPDSGTGTKYTLGPLQQLTAGQSYYWGVEVTLPNGNMIRASKPFTTAPAPQLPGLASPSPFPSVTLISYGFQIPGWTGNTTVQAVAIAKEMAKHVGEVAIGVYNPETGLWVGDTPTVGKPLILVADWAKGRGHHPIAAALDRLRPRRRGQQ